MSVTAYVSLLGFVNSMVKLKELNHTYDSSSVKGKQVLGIARGHTMAQR